MSLKRLVSLAVIAAATVLSGCSGGGLDPSPAPTLVSVALNPNSVVGGDPAVQGVVTLSAVPTTGVTVLLSSDSSFAFVPSALTIPPGTTRGTFAISTTPVQTSAVATISAVANSTTRSALLTLTSGLTANFSVTSLSPAQTRTPNAPVARLVPDQGAGSADSCPLVVVGGSPVLDCQFNGALSTSGGLPIVTYSWTYAFGNQVRTEESIGPSFKPTASGCGFFANQAGPDGPFIHMSVSLRVQSAGGGTSDVRANRNVRIYPAGLCGYGF